MATNNSLPQQQTSAEDLETLKDQWSTRLPRLSDYARNLAEKNVADMLTSLGGGVEIEVIVYQTALEVWRA